MRSEYITVLLLQGTPIKSRLNDGLYQTHKANGPQVCFLYTKRSFFQATCIESMTDSTSRLPTHVLTHCILPFLQPTELVPFARVNMQTYQTVTSSDQFKAMRTMTLIIDNMSAYYRQNVQIIKRYVPALWSYICQMITNPPIPNPNSDIIVWPIESAPNVISWHHMEHV